MALSLGQLELHTVSGGSFCLDGGSMFGVVPKTLWHRKCPADERNRIAMDTNCLLVRTAKYIALIDSGYGDKSGERQRDHLALQSGQVLLNNLAKLDVQPEDVDVVIPSHLHFDHAGGCTVQDASGRLRPAFPRARYLVQRSEWEDATSDLPELAGTYLPEDCLPLEEAGVLELIDGDAQLLPNIACQVTGGHTRGHQILLLGTTDQRAVYLGDLSPTSAHLPTFWTMAYDQNPLVTRRIKPHILGQASDDNWVVFFDHDPNVKAARLRRDEKQHFAVREVLDQ